MLFSPDCIVNVPALETVKFALAQVFLTPDSDVAINISPSWLIYGMFEKPVPGGYPCRVSAFIAYPTFAICCLGVASSSVPIVIPKYTLGQSEKMFSGIWVPQTDWGGVGEYSDPPINTSKIPSGSGVIAHIDVS